MHRTVVDTNVWISALLNPRGAPARVLEALRRGLFVLVISEPLLTELAAVLSRPRILRKYPGVGSNVAELQQLLQSYAEGVVITGAVKLCRDPHDNMLIETALLGRADSIVSRDDDLKGDSELVKTLGSYRVAVLTVQHFLDTLVDDGSDDEV